MGASDRKPAFWRTISGPVQGGRRPTPNVFPQSCNFLCHLHRKMPDLGGAQIEAPPPFKKSGK